MLILSDSYERIAINFNKVLVCHYKCNEYGVIKTYYIRFYIDTNQGVESVTYCFDDETTALKYMKQLKRMLSGGMIFNNTR
jgi:hypothetical protein